ncbi:MAG: autotransporter outer membrane beta-barrel domain-containing protein [Verrucomicrobiales bacterium]|nr:autotransporter outer membrane beta-barrel domain-containing protein [Verrucomicrobiales bacterium]
MWVTMLTVSGLSLIAPLTVTAQTKVVTSSTTESGQSYAGASTTVPPLEITGSGVIYSGTNISAFSSVTNGWQKGSNAVYVDNQAGAYFYDSTGSLRGSTYQRGGAFAATGSSRLELTRVNIYVDTQNEGSGIKLSGSSIGVVTSATIYARSGNGYGAVDVRGASSITVNDVHISGFGWYAYGVYVEGRSSADIDGATISSAGGWSRGIFAVASSTVVARNLNITTNDGSGMGVQSDGGSYIFLESSTIHTMGGDAMGLFAYSGGTLAARDVQIITENARGILSYNANSLVVAENFFIQSNNSDGINIESGASGAFSSGTVQAMNRGVFMNGNSDAQFANADIIAPTGIGIANGTNALRFNGGRIDADAGAIRASGDGVSVATVTFSDNAIINGDLTNSGGGVLTVTLSDSVLTGNSSLGESGIINLSLNNGANWSVTGRSKVTSLHGTNGALITIANVEGEDLSVSGGISGQTALNLTLSDGVRGQREIHVVVDESKTMGNEAFTLGNSIVSGMQTYGLENRGDGAWLVLGGGAGGGLTEAGDAVINSAAAGGALWFAQLDNLRKRMGELRQDKPAGGGLLNNIWVRAYGRQINANSGVYSAKGFSETQYGVDLGTDYLWKPDADNQLYTGVFAGYGGAERGFHTSYKGNTDSGGGGVYATWLNVSGWHTDVVAKGQYFRNEFSGADRGDYDSLGAGVSVEFGKQFQFKDGWFAEPGVQFSYAHLMNENYTTREGMSVNLGDADVLHIHGGARLGRNIKLGNGGLLQAHLKFGGLTQLSTGGQVSVSGGHWRPNLDGVSAVVGAGLVWQLNAESQLHLDYEARFGEKHDEPWGLNLGYRFQF